MKLEEPPNTFIKKQVEVTSKKKGIVNDEFRMQMVMEPIPYQLVEELKEVVEALEESIFDFLKQNIIMIDGKFYSIIELETSWEKKTIKS